MSGNRNKIQGYLALPSGWPQPLYSLGQVIYDDDDDWGEIVGMYYVGSHSARVYGHEQGWYYQIELLPESPSYKRKFDEVQNVHELDVCLYSPGDAIDVIPLAS